MSRSTLQLAFVLLLLPLGAGLCLLCLGDSEREVAAAAPALASQAELRGSGPRATTAAPILSPPPSRGAAVEPEAQPAVWASASAPEPEARSVTLDAAEPAPAPALAQASAGARDLAARASGPARSAWVAKAADRSLGERERLAAVIALAASAEGGYVPEVFRERFPDDPAGELAPGPIDDYEARRALTDALRHPEATVAERVLLLAALGPSQGYAEVASALEEAFADPSPEVRGQVVIELAVSEEPGVGQLLLRAAADPSPEVRLRAVLALGSDPAQQPALEATYDAEGQVRDVKSAIVAQASEHASTPQGAGFLTRVLREEPDRTLRAEALASLAVAAEVDPEGLRAAAGPELTRLLESARTDSGVSESADAERVLRVLQAG